MFEKMIRTISYVILQLSIVYTLHHVVGAVAISGRYTCPILYTVIYYTKCTYTNVLARRERAIDSSFYRHTVLRCTYYISHTSHGYENKI